MAPSNKVCNCTRNITRFTSKSKLPLPFTLFLLTLALADYDSSNPNFIEPLRTRGVDFFSCRPGNITAGSALESNLKVVLNSLVENVNKTGDSISSHGENGDKVYGLAQCRGDFNASACRACVSNITKLPGFYTVCISASIHLSGCFLRYAADNFYPMNLQNASIDAITVCDNTTINGTDGNARGFKDWPIANLLIRVMVNAGSSNVRFATGNESRVYSLAQCWRDLTMTQCRQCLQILYGLLGSCPVRTSQGAAFYDYCVIRYARYKFYGDGVPLLTASTASGSGPAIPPSRAPEGKSDPKMLEWSIGGAVVVLLLVGVVVAVFWKRKVMKLGNSKGLPGHYKPTSELSIAISKSKLNYKFETLQTATKNFDPINKIGQGGFGSVYKGLLDGRQIAVKRLFSNREESVNKFFNEVNLISCVQHKNLVKLLGCSVDGLEKLLVYEYLPNKSLDRFLFDETLGNALDWKRRFDIILGTASGLAYLHQESDIRIIHRDIKASNILLDHLFKPKIADFGLIKYFSEDQSHLSTRIIGTRGYMAPEYLVHGHLTEKVDVYAFGVLVLEIISGRRNKTPMHRNDIPSLLTMVWNYHLSGTIASIIDPNIKVNCQGEILQVVHIALLCTQTSTILRPSMSEVVTFLISKDQNLPEPTQPPYIDVTHLQSNINTNVTLSHSQSNINVALKHSNSNTNTSVSLIDGGTLPNVHSSSPNPMSLNTISISSFGPR